MESPNALRIARKPVPSRRPAAPAAHAGEVITTTPEDVTDGLAGLHLMVGLEDRPPAYADVPPPPLPARPAPQPASSYPQNPPYSAPSQSSAPQESKSPLPPNTATADARKASEPSPSAPKPWHQTLLSDARHLATGLISHPTSSTKHYSILRHSPSLVIYRGPNTSVTLSIFSSASRPFPADRSLWLQRRGLSGDTGMRLASALGATGLWIDVTPSVQASSADAPAGDERGWKRDIERAEKKLAKEGKAGEKRHLPRQTCVVRIPASAADGYFRVVLCSGGPPSAAATTTTTAVGGDAPKPTKRKPLCASPIFRIASLSTDSSILRGASLSSLPLEVGVKVASIVGSNTVGRYIGPVLAPVQSQIQRYQPGFVAQSAGELAYSQSGLGGKVGAVEEKCDFARQHSYEEIQRGEEEDAGFEDVEARPPETIGPDEGPQRPFPLKFQAKVSGGGGGKGGAGSGFLTAELADVPDDIKLRLKGVYFGWICVLPSKSADEGLSQDWHEAIIFVGPSPNAAASVTAKNIVTLHVMHDFGPGQALAETKVKVLVMGYLRRGMLPNPDTTEGQSALSKDVSLVVASLSREAWDPEITMRRMKDEKKAATFAEKYVSARQGLQKQVDRVPMHLVGVRTMGGELRDQALGNGGFWIRRD